MQDECVPVLERTSTSLPKMYPLPTLKKQKNICDGKSLQLTIKSHNERFWVVMDGWEKRQKRKLFITTHLRAFGELSCCFR